ncbi:hypothetical protein [Vibrio crassostreae]|uniref:hypothetical protein n=1 Tax=Vibrio crassostreae TaxID=246167 RepID=UPI001B3176F5|nr:hypothetical protein [Vibrio crassostreae]
MHRSKKFALGIASAVISFGYYSLVVPNEYESTSRFLIKDTSQDSNMAVGVNLIAPTANNPTTPIVMSYVSSSSFKRKLLEANEGEFKQHIISKTNPLNGLSDDSAFEKFDHLLGDMVSLSVDESGTVYKVATRAYDPSIATNINSFTLGEIDTLVNKINKETKQVKTEASKEVLEAIKDEMVKTTNRMKEIQSETRTFNLNENVESTLLAISELKLRKSEIESSLESKNVFLSDSSPEIIAMKRELTAIEKQIESENSKVIESPLVDEFRLLSGNLKMISEAYSVALMNLTSEEANTSNKGLILLNISKPSTAESSVYPVVWHQVANFLIILLCLTTLMELAKRTLPREQNYK